MKAADAAMLIIALVIVWSIYQAHKDPTVRFNLLELLMDNGRVSKTACAFMVTLSVTSGIMVLLMLNGKMTEGYFTAYGAAWVAPLIAKMFAAPPPPSTTTTGTVSTTTTVTEKPL